VPQLEKPKSCFTKKQNKKKERIGIEIQKVKMEEGKGIVMMQKNALCVC